MRDIKTEWDHSVFIDSNTKIKRRKSAINGVS